MTRRSYNIERYDPCRAPTISARLDTEVIDKLDVIAKAKGITRSTLLRSIITKGVRQLEQA